MAKKKYIVISPVKYDKTGRKPIGTELTLDKDEAAQLGKAIVDPKTYEAMQKAGDVPGTDALLERVAQLEAENEALREKLEGKPPAAETPAEGGDGKPELPPGKPGELGV